MKMARLVFVGVLMYAIIAMVMRMTSAHASVIVTVGHLLGTALCAVFFIHFVDVHNDDNEAVRAEWCDVSRAELMAIGCAILVIADAAYIGKPLPIALIALTIIPTLACVAWIIFILTHANERKVRSIWPTQSLEDLRKQRGHDRAMEAIRRTQR